MVCRKINIPNIVTMDDLDKQRKILTRYWGYTSFKSLQEEIIRSVSEGKDTLGLMPTGGGKSLTFQVPAMAAEGICLVVTPLISLMKDQVDRLHEVGIKAMAIHTGMLREEIDISLDNCIYGDYKLLYISPERIGTEIFRNRVTRMKVNLIAVDEAHCISQWGYDFRPSYLKIAILREILGKEVPVLALTATATPAVVDDILDKLEFRSKNVLSTGFGRKNLVYVVRKVENKQDYLLRTFSKVRGSGIIYVRSRKKSREISEFLVKNGISADFYHEGLSAEGREKKQNDWNAGKVRIIVATNAFGMGIDKADVRFVIHWDIPDSIESYFQESGRAGRDGKRSWAVQLYNTTDVSRARERVSKAFPEVGRIKDIYELLCNYLQIPVGGGKNNIYEFNLYDFAAHYKLQVTETLNSIKFLEREGYVELTEELNNPSRIFFTVGRDDLYRFQVANAAFDGFIKLLLRSYTGMFSEYVPVNEEMLSKKSKLSREVIYKYLLHLSNQNIIRYIPGKKSALIIFIEERLERKALIISPSNHADVKEKYIQRLDRLLDYVTSDTRCRVVMLLDYFGQETDRCGQCDVCLARNELDISKYEFDLILERIKEILEKEKVTADQLVSLTGMDEDKSLKVVRWLLDHDKILVDESLLLVWNQ